MTLELAAPRRLWRFALAGLLPPAAFIVGIVEAYSSVYFGGSIGALVLFVLVLLLLVFRPTGLLGREVRGA